MKRIAIVADDVAMPGEKGLSRLHYLAEFMTSKGLDVEIVTADFQHWEKRYRTEEDQKRIRENSACKVTFLHEGAYKKNIDPKRMLSYCTLARNIKKYLENNEYDLVYALIPDNHLCAVAGKYAKKKKLPFIVDVEDLWPEAMRMVLDVPVISDVLFSYFEEPRSHVNIRRTEEGESSAIQGWLDAGPEDHFIHLPGSEGQNFLLLPQVFAVGAG